MRKEIKNWIGWIAFVSFAVFYPWIGLAVFTIAILKCIIMLESNTVKQNSDCDDIRNTNTELK